MNSQFLQEVVHYLKQHSLMVVTAESCTAGLLSSTLAEPPGCGAWLEAAYVTYSADAKIKALEVNEEVIKRYGLTSEQVARAMAHGALKESNANLAISTTGVAGPSAGDGDVPVGTVCFAWLFKGNGDLKYFSETRHFSGDRNEVRRAATEYALQRIRHLHHTTLIQAGH